MGRRRSALGAALGGSSDTQTRGRLAHARRLLLSSLSVFGGASGASSTPPAPSAPFRRFGAGFFLFFSSFFFLFSRCEHEKSADKSIPPTPGAYLV